MGMSASQMRYLGLTARRSDNEFHVQQISQQRLQIATKMQDIATAYTNGMNNRLLQYLDPSTGQYEPLTYEIITDNVTGLGYKLYTSDGKEVVPSLKGIDNPEKIRADAKAKYDAVMSVQCFRFGEDADTLSGKAIDGESFVQYYLSDDETGENALKDKDGNSVDVTAFTEAVKNLNASEFYTYWQENELSFAGGNTLEASSYTEGAGFAQAEYESELARADEIENTRYFADKDCLDVEYLEDKLRSGDWFLNKPNINNERVNISWSEVTAICDILDTSDDAAVAAEYEAQSAFWQQKDKQLELEVKKLETEHNALQTEIDSVKKVINDNVEKSFKTFSG